MGEGKNWQFSKGQKKLRLSLTYAIEVMQTKRIIDYFPYFHNQIFMYKIRCTVVLLYCFTNFYVEENFNKD